MEINRDLYNLPSPIHFGEGISFTYLSVVSKLIQFCIRLAVKIFCNITVASRHGSKQSLISLGYHWQVRRSFMPETPENFPGLLDIAD